MTRLRVLFVSVLLILGSVACSGDAGDTAEDVADAVESAAGDVADRAEDVAEDAADRAEDVVNDRNVDIDNFAYEPKTLTVKRGTEVTWVNQDDAPHTVTSDEGGALDSEQLEEGDEFSERFLEQGTYAYHCEVHGKDRMSGKVVVED